MEMKKYIKTHGTKLVVDAYIVHLFPIKCI